MKLKTEVKVAIIAGFFVITAAIITGIFSGNSKSGKQKPDEPDITGNNTTIVKGNNNIVNSKIEAEKVSKESIRSNLIDTLIIGNIKPGITRDYLVSCLGVNQIMNQTEDFVYKGKTVSTYLYTFDNLYITAHIWDNWVIAVNFELRDRSSFFPIQTILGTELVLGKVTFSDAIKSEDNPSIEYIQGGNKRPSSISLEFQYPNYLGAGPFIYIYNTQDFKNATEDFHDKIISDFKNMISPSIVSFESIKKCRITSVTILDNEFEPLHKKHDLNRPMSDFFVDIELSWY